MDDRHNIQQGEICIRMEGVTKEYHVADVHVQALRGVSFQVKQGEYIIQNPIFRSLLNIKFPKPIYKQFK